MIEAAKTDNSVAVFRVLGKNPGKAVKEAATAALSDGSAKALHEFFATKYPAAQYEDDRVAVFTVLATAGPYTTMAANVALEGPEWMLRDFLTTVHPRMVQLDADASAHIAAVLASLAHAAKIAQDAQTDAAHASKAAAEARKAADEAVKWADAAKKSADKAAGYAKQADDYADAAEQSAKDASASAATAKAAALAARAASRRANYSANQATASASSAVQSAIAAQASASAARASAVAAKQGRAGGGAGGLRGARDRRRQAEGGAGGRGQEGGGGGPQEQAERCGPVRHRRPRQGGEAGHLPRRHQGGLAGGRQRPVGRVHHLGRHRRRLPADPAAPGRGDRGHRGHDLLITGVAGAVITGFTDGWTSNAFLSSAAGVAISVLTGGIPLTKFGGVSGVIAWGTNGLRSAPVIAARLEQELISPAVGVFTTKWDQAKDTVTDTVSDAWDALTPW